MNQRHVPAFAFAAALLAAPAFLSAPAAAAVPKNALGAIAVSPNGKTVLAAGDNRVLYVLDAAKLTVRKKIWLGVNPLSLFYAKSGRMVVLHDSKGGLRFISTQTWKTVAKVTDAESVAVAEDADLIYAVGRPRGYREKAKTAVYAYELGTGKQVLDASVKGSLNSVGTLPDGSLIFTLTRPDKSEDEKKEKTPNNLKGIEKETFKLQHDGRTAEFITLDASGKEIGRFTTWYSGRILELVGTAGAVFGIAYNNVNAQFDLASGDVKLFQAKNSYNYGIGYSATQGVLATGGLANGSITNLADGTGVSYKIDRIGGWPEYFKGFAIAGNGTIYGGTTAYRLVKIAPGGKVETTLPVY